MKTNRIIPLEGCRGIAAFIVVINHFLVAFTPYFAGTLPETRLDSSIIGNWYFVFCNGAGAVNFFFVLSGFVLCSSYFKTGELEILKLGVIKRLPRLVGPVIVTTVASYFLFKFGGYYFVEASNITKSSWLAGFAYSGWTDDFSPSITKAAIQGLTTFFTGEANYNSNLWTMKPEFIGSILVFGIASLLYSVIKLKKPWVIFCIFAIWGLSTYPYLLPFIVGLFLSAKVTQKPLTLNYYSSVFFILIGLYLLGYAIPEKDYLWVGAIKHPSLIAINLQTILHTIGSYLIIISIIGNNRIYASLDKSFSSYLGRLSFPLYLVHTLVICSLSSFIFLELKNISVSQFWVMTILFASTLVGSILIAIPLVIFDEFWVRYTGRIVKKIFNH